MLTVLNLPRDRRNLFENILILGIIPTNEKHEPKTLDPYLKVIVDEILHLQGKEIYDAYQEKMLSLKIDITLNILDYVGIGKVFKVSGSGAYKGCVWCDITGKKYICTHSYHQLHNQVLLVNHAYATDRYGLGN